MGSTRRVPATLGLPRTGVSVLSPSTLLRLPAALYGAGPALSAVPVFGSSTTAWIRLRLRVVSSPPQRFRQPKACAHFPQMRRTFSLLDEQLRQPEARAHSPRVRRAFSLQGERLRSQRLGRPLPRCGAPFPFAASGPGNQRLGRPLPGCGAPFPFAAPMRSAGGVSGSL